MSLWILKWTAYKCEVFKYVPTHIGEMREGQWGEEMGEGQWGEEMGEGQWGRK